MNANSITCPPRNPLAPETQRKVESESKVKGQEMLEVKTLQHIVGLKKKHQAHNKLK